MTLNRTWTINSFKADPETGNLRMVFFTLTFRDPARPGVESVHMGEGMLPGPDGLPASTPEADIIALLEEQFQIVKDNMEQHHQGQIEYAWIKQEGIDTRPDYTTGYTAEDVNRERQARIGRGTTVDITGHGKIPLQGDYESQMNLQALAFAASMRIAAGDTETTKIFRDARNQDHALTPPQFMEMWQKGSEWIEGIYNASWAIKAMDPIPADYRADKHWVSTLSA